MSSNQLDLEPKAPVEDQQIEEELRAELIKTEEEIETLRQVLAARIKHSNDLKRKLGISVWKGLHNDLQQSFKSVQDSTASLSSTSTRIFSSPYQKTTETVKLAAEKTTDIFGVLGDSISRKLVDVKNSSTFKSIEERVGSTIGKTGLSTGSLNNNNIGPTDIGPNTQESN